MVLEEDFEMIREEVEEILDYSGFFMTDNHIWQAEDDDSHLNDDGGPYAMWIDLNRTDVITAGTRDLFEWSEREAEEWTFDVMKWCGWTGTVIEAIEKLEEYGLSPDIADAVIDDVRSVDEEIDE